LHPEFKAMFTDEKDYEKPIGYYNKQEFLNLIKLGMESCIKEHLSEAEKDVKAELPKPDDTIDIDEAAKVTGFKKKSIYSKVSRSELPSLTRGRPLMFSRAELQLWMKIGRPDVAEMELKRRKGEI